MTTLATSEPMTAAVIGTGKISDEHLRFLSNASTVKLAGVCDLSESMARFAADRTNADQFFTNHRQMLDEVKPDVVHVLTPPHTHFSLVKDCLQANSHVIVEKPAAPTRSEFLDLWSEAQRCGKQLIEDHNYRFNEPVQEIKRLVDSGRLGKVREVEVRMALPIRDSGRYADENLPHPSHRLPAGVIHEFVTHLCYLALHFMPQYERVTASWKNYGGGGLFTFDDLDASIEGGQVRTRLRFSCNTAPDCLTLTVRGTNGWAQTDLFHPYQWLSLQRSGGPLSPLVNQWLNGAGFLYASVNNFRKKITQQTPYSGLHRFLERTYRSLGDGSQPPVTYQDMNNVSKLIDALLDEANQR